MLLSAQEVFPIQYGTKFDTALQALIAGLVCKLEQLLPVPNLSQVCTCTLIAFSHFPCVVLTVPIFKLQCMSLLQTPLWFDGHVSGSHKEMGTMLSELSQT